jgi:hypothetical protein
VCSVITTLQCVNSEDFLIIIEMVICHKNGYNILLKTSAWAMFAIQDDGFTYLCNNSHLLEEPQ